MKVVLNLRLFGDTTWVQSDWDYISKCPPGSRNSVAKDVRIHPTKGRVILRITAGSPMFGRLMDVIKPLLDKGSLEASSSFKRVYTPEELIKNHETVSASIRPSGPELSLGIIDKVFHHKVVCPACNAIEETQTGPIILKSDNWARDIYRIPGYTCIIISNRFRMLLKKLNIDGVRFSNVMLQSGQSSDKFYQMHIKNFMSPLVPPTGIIKADICRACGRPEGFHIVGDEVEDFDGIHIPPEDAPVGDELHFRRQKKPLPLLAVTRERFGFNQPGPGFVQGRFRFLIFRNSLFKEIVKAKIRGMSYRPVHFV